MANAELKRNNDGSINMSIIELTMTIDDEAYVAVNFVTKSPTPTGKLVQIEPKAGIIGWTNAQSYGTFNPLAAGSSSLSQGHTKHIIASGSSTFTISARRAADRTSAVDKFSPLNAASDDPAIVSLVDSVHPISNRRVKIKRWEFPDGIADYIIITIVMLDDEGGGDRNLRINVGDRIYELGTRLVME